MANFVYTVKGGGRQEGETGKDWREGIVWGRMKAGKGGGRKVEGECGQKEREERLRREPEAQAVTACGG